MARAFRPMIMQDIVNKIYPGGWCGGGEVVEIPVRSVFFFPPPPSLSWWITVGEEHEKRRKGGNKSVATNMSVARLFIGTRGRKDEAALPGQDIVFKGWIQDVLL